jgi:cobalt-zinc-cadmium efflux system protein
LHSHGPHHAHGHHHHGSTGKILKWSLAITVLFVVVQVFAALKADSLALLSDAGHNFTDALALLLAWFGFRFAAMPANEIKTYGYHRAGVLAAFINALSLLALAGFILYESYHRLRDPREVEETIMLVIAFIGLAVNLGIMWGLHHDAKHDINIRSAWAHMFGDALGSVGIIIGALAIRYTGIQEIDPLLSILIALLIVWTAWDIIKESLNILLEGLPRGIELKEVQRSISGVDGVLDVHDLHVWSLGSSTHALSCHVVISDVKVSAADQILRTINQVLHDRFGIHHSTLQMEHTRCVPDGKLCPVSPSHRHTGGAHDSS